MTPPTAVEVQEAWRGIDVDGPEAPGTMRLALLAVANPVLRQVLKNMRESHVAKLDPKLELFAEAMLSGALIYGLNLGLRIGEARAGRIEELRNGAVS